MRKRCPDELLCDLAETYHIIDPASVPVRTLAILACGLPADSRVFLYLNGQRLTTGHYLQAAMLDCVRTLVWFQTKDGHEGHNRPPSVLEALTREPEKRRDNGLMKFESGAEFEAARKRLFEGGDG